MKKFIIILSILQLAFISVLLSQDIEEANNLSVLLRKEYNFGLIVHTEGFGVNFTKSKNLTYSLHYLYESDFVYMKNPKETSSSSVISDGTYVFGKINDCFILRNGLGLYKINFSKEGAKSIEIRTNFSLGLSLAILKPYYLQIEDPITNNSYYSTFSSKTDATNIIDHASFFRGVSEITAVPGLYSKLGFGFNYGKNNSTVEMLEIGTILDAYPTTLKMLYNNNVNNNLLLTFYIKLAFGKRSY